jgi:aldehyde:ferredoxin oxidoreductase
METAVWRADVGSRSVAQTALADGWERLGGRGLIARILLDEVPAACDPLGPQNILIFAPGLLAGHRLSSCDRISVGGKSPLTGGVKESNAGGTIGLRLARLAIKALLVQGQPQAKGWWLLHLDAQGGRFEPADDLSGLGIYPAAALLRQRYGENVSVALIGPGGEMGLTAAGISNLDKDGEPSRIAARGGLGALMGAKRLKAIVVDDEGCPAPPLADPKLFREAGKYFVKKLLEHPQTALYRDYGTAAMTMMCHTFGGLPTRGFSAGEFEHAEKVSGETMRELLLARGGESSPQHSCMAGCAIHCSNVFGDATGKKIVSPLEYESMTLLGANLGIADLDAIAAMNWELNDLGLDSIDVGAALGVAAQAGQMKFGDAKRTMQLLGEIRRGTSLGRILGNGAAATGEALGVERVPVVKRQAMAGYDPRAIKGTGVTYATSPQGADHTAGLTIRAKIDHLDPAVQAETSRKGQISNAGYDTLGVCAFATFGFAIAPAAIRDLIRGRYGWDVGDDILTHLGKETIRLERAFNRAAGLGPQDDRLPQWMTREPLPPHNTVFDVPDEDLDGIFADLE